MESTLTVCLVFIGTIILAAWQGGLIRSLSRCYLGVKPTWPPGRPYPKAAVILPLRGHDPFLSEALRNLACLDYPNFLVYLIVDSETDPAWDAVHLVMKEFPNRFFASTLTNRRTNCSLKNSSILQAIHLLPTDIEVVAFVDADAIVPTSWLRNLVTPFMDEEIGGTSGIRWFAPTELSCGSYLRCYWNHIAAPMIYSSQIPWGGSMVIRRRILDSGLADEWSQMFCEDAHTINFLHRNGLKLAYVPQATIVNRENISLFACIQFINRQMLIFRLYNPNWPRLVITILLSALLRITHDLLIVRSLWVQDFVTAFLLICCHPLILLVTRFETRHLDLLVIKTVEEQGQEIRKNPLPGIIGYIGVEIVFLTSIFTSLFTRFANWRGICYRIRGPKNIHMLSYAPYASASNPASDSTVI